MTIEDTLRNLACPHGVSLLRYCVTCENEADAKEQRLREEQRRAADARIVEYHQAMYGPSPDDANLAEPEDVCRGCGAPNVSHMRTPSDDYCPECRYADREGRWTIRDELKLLGPEAVRRGMLGFEHRQDSGWCSAPPCPDGSWGADGPCCFLTHAAQDSIFHRRMSDPATRMFYTTKSAIELAFECGARTELRQECITFLAEHGTTPEAPVSRDTEVVESVR